MLKFITRALQWYLYEAIWANICWPTIHQTPKILSVSAQKNTISIL